MRNLTPSAEDFEKYMRQFDQVVLWEEPAWETKPVGPFGIAPFVVPERDRLRLKVSHRLYPSAAPKCHTPSPCESPCLR